MVLTYEFGIYTVPNTRTPPPRYTHVHHGAPSSVITHVTAIPHAHILFSGGRVIFPGVRYEPARNPSLYCSLLAPPALE